MNRAVATVLMLSAAAAVVAQPTSSYWGDLEPGAYFAGVKAISFEGSRESEPRRIPALVFYPAGADGQVQTFRQLITRTCATDNCAQVWIENLGNYRKDLPPQKVGALLDHPLRSRFEAHPVSGKFPVVVFDGGLTSDALTYVPLNEYLASHGFIVISLPSLPHAEGKPLAFDVAGVESKARDILTVLQQLDRVPNTHSRRAALAAWSVGGVSTALAQMQVDNVRAVLSLDGGMGYDYGPPLAKQSSLYDREKATVAYLHVTGMRPNPHNVPKLFDFFAALPSRYSFLAELQNLNHSHFTAQGGAVAYVGDESDTARQFWAAHEQLAPLTLQFLKDFVATSEGKGFLEHANELSPALLSVKAAKATR